MTAKMFLDPAEGGTAYKLTISGDAELVGDGGGTVTWFLTGTQSPNGALVEAVVDAMRDITDITSVECRELGTTGTVVFT